MCVVNFSVARRNFPHAPLSEIEGNCDCYISSVIVVLYCISELKEVLATQTVPYKSYFVFDHCR